MSAELSALSAFGRCSVISATLSRFSTIMLSNDAGSAPPLSRRGSSAGSRASAMGFGPSQAGRAAASAAAPRRREASMYRVESAHELSLTTHEH